MRSRGLIAYRAALGKGHKGGGPGGRSSRCRPVILLPEDEVGTVDLAPAAAVLEDASVAHHCTLLKLGPVIGHVLGRQGHSLHLVLSPLYPYPPPLLTAP